ncbi:hypothetical protein RKE30_41450 [Streptomyces sp. Li-HN-5-11]|uniref:anti-sigma factor family protein n=1 Tax=Streptomyces sp. Li-HN-5-11 TaxID=3075432 RepID=UPI0028A7B13C|nr:hypothetical protein [Streptomyces sp. Li-HN-5-11]WNM36352.1 hypothetical protein RKE30_41450 [Streptomyces sp. Li-HN-5-11]
MTSTTDTAGHPDVTEISDLTEGLLAPSRAEDLRRHLGRCASCADVHASLEEIRSLLGTLPEPQGMPSDVADRIDAALAAEHSADGHDDSAGDSTHVSRETTATDRPAGRARTSSTGPGRKATPRRGRRRIAVLGTAFTVAALGVVSVVLASLHDGKGSDTTAHGRPSASTDTFSEGTLKTQVTDLLDKAQKPEGTSHAPHSLGVDPERGTGKPNVLKSAPTVTLPSCVQQGINNAGTPLAAQKGTFDGKDAYLVVLPDASGASTRVTAYIVDATCVQHPSTAATVLLEHSYARS